MWPLYFDLDKGDEVGLNIAFEPSSVGEQRERLIMVCDNCQVKDFTLRGFASDVDIQLEEIDGVPLQHLPCHLAQGKGTEGNQEGASNQVCVSSVHVLGWEVDICID